MLYYRRNYGSRFPDGCICGPSGLVWKNGLGGFLRDPLWGVPVMKGIMDCGLNGAPRVYGNYQLVVTNQTSMKSDP